MLLAQPGTTCNVVQDFILLEKPTWQGGHYWKKLLWRCKPLFSACRRRGGALSPKIASVECGVPPWRLISCRLEAWLFTQNWLETRGCCTLIFRWDMLLRGCWLLSSGTCFRWFAEINPKNIWVFPKIGVPQNGWFIMENPIKMGWFGGTTIFGNIHITQTRNKIASDMVRCVTRPLWWPLQMVDLCTMFSGIQLRFHKRYILGCGGLIDGIQVGLEIRSSESCWCFIQLIQIMIWRSSCCQLWYVSVSKSGDGWARQLRLVRGWVCDASWSTSLFCRSLWGSQGGVTWGFFNGWIAVPFAVADS